MNKRKAFNLGDGLILCREYFKVSDNHIGENFYEWITTCNDFKNNGFQNPKKSNNKIKVNITKKDKDSIIEVNKESLDG